MNASPEQTIATWKKNFLQKHTMAYAEDHLEVAATNRVALQVELSGVELYPTFQLRSDRTPYPVMKDLLRIADEHNVEADADERVALNVKVAYAAVGVFA